jgi:hypothetical protein
MFLGVLAKLRNATVSFFASVLPLLHIQKLFIDLQSVAQSLHSIRFAWEAILVQVCHYKYPVIENLISEVSNSHAVT